MSATALIGRFIEFKFLIIIFDLLLITLPFHLLGLKGLIGAIELEPIQEHPTKRAFSAFLRAFERGCLIRTTGDIIALSPPLIINKAQIDELVVCIGDVLSELE